MKIEVREHGVLLFGPIPMTVITDLMLVAAKLIQEDKEGLVVSSSLASKFGAVLAIGTDENLEKWEKELGL